MENETVHLEAEGMTGTATPSTSVDYHSCDRKYWFERHAFNEGRCHYPPHKRAQPVTLDELTAKGWRVA